MVKKATDIGTEIRSHKDSNVDPINIKDLDAYRKWLAYHESPTFSEEGRRIETSDPDIIIDPFGNLAFIKKAILRLPVPEQQTIINRCMSMHTIRRTIQDYKSKAFGFKAGHYAYTNLMQEKASTVLEMMGRMMTDAEVRIFISKEWGFDIPKNTIIKFRNENKDKIQAINDDYVRNYNDVKLSHKKGRLVELSKIYNEIDSNDYNAPTNANKEMKLKIIKQIKDEVEDPKLRIEASISGRIDIVVGYQVQEEIMKDMTINSIVIAKAAAKLGVNPTFINNRLYHSIYAKNTGFNGERPDKSKAFYPKVIYNWDRIEKAQSVKDDSIEFEMVDDQSELKNLLIEKLREKKLLLSQGESDIQSIEKDK